MNKKGVILVFAVVFLLSISFTSASWLDDFYAKITGDVGKTASSGGDIRTGTGDDSGEFSGSGDSTLSPDSSGSGSTSQESWTKWYNRDSPGGTGDWETLNDLKKANPEICSSPSKIECQTATGLDYSQTGEVVTCSPDKGAICVNSQQPDGKCDYDYRVRFYCVASTATTTPTETLTPQEPTPSPTPTPVPTAPETQVPSPLGPTPIPETQIPDVEPEIAPPVMGVQSYCLDGECIIYDKETITTTINGESFEISLSYIGKDKTRISINSQETQNLKIGESGAINNLVASVSDVVYFSGDEGISYVKFSLIKEDEFSCSDSGCELNNQCYSTGYRTSRNFCDNSGEFIRQLSEGDSCSENFECGSNLCVNGQCLQEQGFFDRFSNWVGGLFGIGTPKEKFNVILDNNLYQCQTLGSRGLGEASEISTGLGTDKSVDVDLGNVAVSEIILSRDNQQYGCVYQSPFLKKKPDLFNALLDDNLYQCQSVEVGDLGEAPEISTELGTDTSVDVDLGNVIVPEFSVDSDGKEYRCIYSGYSVESTYVESKIKCSLEGECFYCVDGGEIVNFPIGEACIGELIPVPEAQLSCRGGECFYCEESGEVVDFPLQGCPGNLKAVAITG